MPIVMDLGFGEGGDAGDRGTVSKQATRGHEVYPGSGPRRENPTLACLLLITTEPVITGVRRCNLAWRCVCGSMSRERSVDLLWSSLSGVEIVDLSTRVYGVCRSCPPRWTLLAFIYGEARSRVP